MQIQKKAVYLHPQSRNNATKQNRSAGENKATIVIKNGTIAQLVEQRTENPCVPGSIPGGTTYKRKTQLIFNQLRFSLMQFAPHLHHMQIIL